MDRTRFTREKEVCTKPYALDLPSAEEIAGILRKEFLGNPSDLATKDGWKNEKSDDGVLHARAWYDKSGNLDKELGFDAWVKCDKQDSVYYEYNQSMTLRRVMRINTPPQY